MCSAQPKYMYAARLERPGLATSKDARVEAVGALAGTQIGHVGLPAAQGSALDEPEQTLGCPPKYVCGKSIFISSRSPRPAILPVCQPDTVLPTFCSSAMFGSAGLPTKNLRDNWYSMEPYLDAPKSASCSRVCPSNRVASIWAALVCVESLSQPGTWLGKNGNS